MRPPFLDLFLIGSATKLIFYCISRLFIFIEIIIRTYCRFINIVVKKKNEVLPVKSFAEDCLYRLEKSRALIWHLSSIVVSLVKSIIIFDTFYRKTIYIFYASTQNTVMLNPSKALGISRSTPPLSGCALQSEHLPIS